MKWLQPLFADIDLPSRYQQRVPPLVTKLVVAGNCLGTMAIVRALLDLIWPGVAPMALIFPPIMMATLFAGLLSGTITLTVGMLWAWYVVMPVANKSLMASPAAVPTVAAVAIIGVITLLTAYVFREAVRQAQLDRNRQIADRDLFLREVEHRVKNNFAIVISLLDLQQRRAEPATAEALATAKARIEGISRAHQHLYRGDIQQADTVEISTYLSELCAALADALSLERHIELHCDSDAVAVDRDRAVSIGLVVNELVTNAAKHAFAGRDSGRIDVMCRAQAPGLRITVADDGVGIAPRKPASRQGGLGTKLVDAFARQAGGTVAVESDGSGTRVSVDLAA